jgi:hypothetical protein
MTYLELQRQLIDKLKELGVYYAYDERLSLFWLRIQFPSLAEYIDPLVRMRTEGKESYDL